MFKLVITTFADAVRGNTKSLKATDAEVDGATDAEVDGATDAEVDGATDAEVDGAFKHWLKNGPRWLKGGSEKKQKYHW